MTTTVHPFKPQADLSRFAVVTCISNPRRYMKRYELYHKFAGLCADAGVKLITVELQTLDRPFMVTEASNPCHLQLRSVEEIWHKENLMDVGIQHAKYLDPKLTKVAWVDADCFPMIPMREWFEETWHALELYQFVQMWEALLNFGPQGQMISGPQESFMKTYVKHGARLPLEKTYTNKIWGYSGFTTIGAPGLAWAANIDALDAVGGLIDFCILGSGDWCMANCLVGSMRKANKEFESSKYAEALFEWQAKAERWIKRDVGYVPVNVGHWFHGAFKNRQYGTRGEILKRNEYNPYTDIKYDVQGVLQLEAHTKRQIRLRDEIRAYFMQRDEDSTEL